MATEFPEGDQDDGPQAPRDDSDPGPEGSDEPGAVPLLPPGDPRSLPGRLETAPDGSIRPAPLLGDPGPPGDAGPSNAHDGAAGLEFAPPAPGLIDDEAAVSSPPWLLADDAQPAPAESSSDTERAAWPTVGADADAESSPSGVAAEEPTEQTIEAAAPPRPEQPPEAAAPPPAEQPPAAADPLPTPQQAPVGGHDAPAPQGESGDAAAMSIRAPETASSGEDMYDVPLGTLVYRSGLLSADQIESALAESERIGKRLGEVLIDTKMIDERDLGRLLAGQKGLPFLDLGQMEIDSDATALLPAASARIYCALPIALEKGAPVVAVSDPTNGLVVEGVRRAMGGELTFAVATRSDLQRAIASNYGEDTDPAGGAAMASPPASDAPAPDATTPDAPAQAHDLDEPTVPDAPTEMPAAPEEPPPGPMAPEELPPLPLTPEAPEIDAPALAAEDTVAAPEPLLPEPEPTVAASEPAPPVAEPTVTAPEPAPHVPEPAMPAMGSATAPGGTSSATPGEKTVRVMIRLSDGDQIDAGAFTTQDQAAERARALIASIDGQGDAEWPFLEGRFVRPQTIVSIDLVEERPRY